MPTETEIYIGLDKVMDVREVPCTIKHGLILKTFFELPVGDHFILRNGHEPVPLRNQLETEFPGTFAWEIVHRRPDDVAVKITKVKAFEVPAEPPRSSCAASEP